MHLVKLCAALQYDNYPRVYRPLTGVEIAVSSRQLVNDLAKLEAYPNKTGVHGTPQIPPSLMRHMYRGYVDGDGGWHLHKHTQNWRFSASGSAVFIRDMQQWLMNQLGLNRTKIRTSNKTAILTYMGNRQSLRIAELLYADAAVYLDRKYAQYHLIRAWCHLPE